MLGFPGIAAIISEPKITDLKPKMGVPLGNAHETGLQSLSKGHHPDILVRMFGLGGGRTGDLGSHWY